MAGAARESVAESGALHRADRRPGLRLRQCAAAALFREERDRRGDGEIFSRGRGALALPVLLYNAPGFAAGVTIKPALRGQARAPSQHRRHEGQLALRHGRLPGRDARQSRFPRAGRLGRLFLYGASLWRGRRDSLLGELSAALSQELYDAFLAGDAARARELHFKLFNLNNAVSGKHGVAGVKAAMNVVGLHGGEPRSPLIALDSTQVETLRALFAANKLL